jgi:integrase/recombinase XerD
MTSEIVAAQQEPADPGRVYVIHTLDELPGESTADVERIKVVAGEFLAGYDPRTARTFADHLGYPWRVVATTKHAAGSPRPVAHLRNGCSFLVWCWRQGITDPFHQVTSKHIKDWQREAKDSRNAAGDPLHPTTVGQMVSAVSALYDWLCENGPDGPEGEATYADWQPVVLNRKALKLSTRTKQSSTRSLTPGEIAQIQLVADHDPAHRGDPLRTGTWVKVLYELGVRIEELTGLKREDMSIMDGRRVLTVTGKGGDRRTMAITNGTAARIDRYLAARDAKQGTAVPALRGQVSSRKSEPLFAAVAPKTGRLVAMRSADCAAKLMWLAEMAEIENHGEVTPHTARHSWASNARQAGIPDSVIQKHFGHASGSTTDRYGHHVMQIRNSPVDKVAEVYAAALLHTFSAGAGPAEPPPPSNEEATPRGPEPDGTVAS